jgi:hypothetical protein
MLTFEQYGHTYKSAKSLILSAFENLPTDEIVFQEVGDKLHVLIYAAAADVNDVTVAMASLQDPDILGDSIEVQSTKGPTHFLLHVDQKLLEKTNTILKK